MVVLRKPTVHTFNKSFKESKMYEAELDKAFGQAYIIEQATREQERFGIDRVYEHRLSRVRYSVEYKTDHKTPETGNVFIETTSVDSAGKRGWAFTSTCQVLIYFIPGFEYALRADMMDIKRRLPEWIERFAEAPAMNKDRSGKYYRTLGQLVPLSVFRESCVDVHDVAFPLDALEPGFTPGIPFCIHEIPVETCYCCGNAVETAGI